MSVEQAIRKVLIEGAAVVFHVAQRVYPLRRPTGTVLPCIVYQVVSQELNQALEAQEGIERTRMSVEVLASTYSGAKDLRDAVQLVLVDFTGTKKDEVIYSTRLESSIDLQEATDPGSEFGTYRIVMDFIIWHEPE